MSDLSNDLASLRIQRNAPPPTRRKFPTWLLVLALLGGGSFVGYRFGKPWLEAQVFKVEVQVTEVASVSPVQASVELTSTGYVVPQTTAKIGSKVIGRITESLIKEGQTVQAGQLLYKVDATDQERLVATGRARVGSARARALVARAQVEEMQVQQRRQKLLVDKGAAPSATVEDLDARIKALQAQVLAADAETVAAAAEAEATSVILKNFVITAPIDGTVMGKPAAVGDVTFPEAQLAEVADFSSLLVESDVPEGRLHLVKVGAPCEIALDAQPDGRFPGTVVELGPRLNRSKATATVKVKFDAPPAVLRPEMSARVSFLAKQMDEATRNAKPKTVVPGGTVVERAGEKVVFVVEEGKVRRVPVKVGPAYGAGFELIDGPSPGTRIVKEPPAVLADGQSVKEKSS